MANNKYLEEIDDELGLEEEPSQPLSESNDDTQLEYTSEQPSIETGLEDDLQPPPPPPPTAQERYANILKQAAAAGPRASDYRSAALSRMFSGIGASTPGYLSRMSQTLYHQPDFSWMDEGRKDLADFGDYDIKAKEAEKQRLVDKAAGIRKEAIEEVKSQEVQARLEALKPAPEEYRKTAEQQLGFPIPPGTNKKKIDDLLIDKGVSKSRVQSEKPVSDNYRKIAAEELSRISGKDVDLTGMSSNEIKNLLSIVKFGQITPEVKARIDTAIQRNELAKLTLEGVQDRAEKNQQNKDFSLLVPEFGIALTPRDAEKLKETVVAQNILLAGIDDIAKNYGKLKAESVRKAPKTVEKIGLEGKNLVMQFKELYGLGAPQAAELKFLFSLVDSDPVKVGETLLSDTFIGTNVEQKLNKLKEIVKRNVQKEAESRLRPKKGTETAPAPTQPEQPAGKKIETERETLDRLEKKYGGK